VPKLLQHPTGELLSEWGGMMADSVSGSPQEAPFKRLNFNAGGLQVSTTVNLNDVPLRADALPAAPIDNNAVLVLHTALAASFGDDDIINAVRRAYFPHLSSIQFGFLR
jgi:hypothetical protein